MNLTNVLSSRLKKAVTASTLMIASIFLATSLAGAQSADKKPYFNWYDNVPGIGDESDFLRIRQDDGTKVDTLEACANEEVTLWVYVHNGSEPVNNGENLDGPGVAQGTKLNVALPTNFGKNLPISATISANNADSVTDSTTITCGTEEVKMEYIPGSANIFTEAAGHGTVTVADNIVGNGALIGWESNNGTFPGCWEFRGWVTLKVKLVKKDVPPTPKPPVPVPPTIPDTGFGSVIGMLSVVAVAGAVLHRVYTVRRSR